MHATLQMEYLRGQGMHYTARCSVDLDPFFKLYRKKREGTIGRRKTWIYARRRLPGRLSLGRMLGYFILLVNDADYKELTPFQKMLRERL